jgi:RHS repeat-associated protein
VIVTNTSKGRATAKANSRYLGATEENEVNQAQGHKANDVFAPKGAWQSDVSAPKNALGYEPFGSLLPGRNYSSSSYNYGFNGKRKDDEIHGSTGTSYDYGMRMQDPRVGRFLSIDPLAAKFPHYSPYHFAGNSPISHVDLDGQEDYYYLLTWDDGGNPVLTLDHVDEDDLIPGYMGSLYINGFYTGDSWYRESIQERANNFATYTKEQWEDYQRRSVEERDEFKRKIEAAGQEGGEAGAMIMYASRMKKGTWSGDVDRRRTTARSFMSRSGQRNMDSKILAFDLSRPVDILKLKRGTVVEQWVKSGEPVGKWFAPKNSDVNKLGIDPTGRTRVTFTLTEDVEVLSGTADDFDGWKGGGTQYFSPELITKTAKTGN